jgi:hypothetical protein
MANDAKPLEELNAGANQVVEQIKHQLLGTADAYFNFLRKTSRPTLQVGQTQVKS